MKQYMRLTDYCRESGFPEKVLRRLCKGEQADKFCRRSTDSKQGQLIITVPEFEKLWREGKI